MKDFKGKTENELNKVLSDKREELRVFRFAMSGGKIKNVKSGRAIRTAIAQILTELNIQKTK
ncbi:MAG: 50S ribosomal protein L29 [Candidatus Taylorbacteria bacterium]|nr:50S ribosomal protein L29 [Candidatus Taylorbacteria bacterium]